LRRTGKRAHTRAVTRTLRRLILLPLATALVLAIPATASAKVLCVKMSGGDCDTNLTYPNIHDAVADAHDGDTIRLHPESYTEAVDAGVKTLTFDSPGAATITGPDGQVALSMLHGGTVRSLTVVGGRKTDPGGTAPSAIRFASTGDFSLTLTGVHLTGGDGTGGSVDGGLGLEVSNGNNAGNDTRVAIDASTIDSGSSSSSGGDGLSFIALGGTLSISNSNVHGADAAGSANGLHVIGAADATVTGSLLEGEHGARIENATFTAVRDHFVTDASNGFGAGLSIGGANGPPATRPTTATVVDSLVEALPSGNISNSAAFVSPGTAPVQLIARGSTFVAEKPNSSGGAVVVQRFADGDPAASIALHNSIVRAFDGDAGSADLVADRAPISADHSAFSSVAIRNGGSSPAAGSDTNIAGDPLFASATDFSLAPSSPLIDRGDPAIVTAGELDLAGASRALDGNGDCSALPDIGAYERPAAAATHVCNPPPPPVPAPVVSGFGVTNKVFAPVAKGGKVASAAKHKTKKKVKRGTRFRYRLSEASTVKIAIQRRLTGRRITKGKGTSRKTVCVKQTRKNRKKRKCTRYKRVRTIPAAGKAGPNSTPFNGRAKGKPLPPGRYRATIVVTDARGKKSKPKRLVFRIVKP
jgi:hypothetical protein